MPPPSLSIEEGRRIALAAQGLLGPRAPGGPAGVLHLLGAVQLDTISVLARSHLLVAWARLGPVEREGVEQAYWAQPPTAFEYWSHAACIIPLEHWPTFEFRRRARRARGRRWHRLEDPARSSKEILARLRSDGPLTATELGGAKRGGPWWDWTEEKIAVEWLLDIGEVVCTRRQGWRRVYDLPERVLPSELLGEVPADAECHRRLVSLAGLRLGVATVAELAAHHGMRIAEVAPVLADAGLTEVRVEGTRQRCYAHPAALDSLARKERCRTTLLSPFDSLVWDRERTERLFGFVHRLEAYVPKPARVHGYFAMPVLAGGRLVGRVDPAREGRTLVARQVGLLERAAVPAVGRALREAARWVGAETVRVERVEPEDGAQALRALVT